MNTESEISYLREKKTVAGFGWVLILGSDRRNLARVMRSKEPFSDVTAGRITWADVLISLNGPEIKAREVEYSWAHISPSQGRPFVSSHRQG